MLISRIFGIHKAVLQLQFIWLVERESTNFINYFLNRS